MSRQSFRSIFKYGDNGIYRYLIEYELEDESTILLVAPPGLEPTRPVKAAAGADQNVRRAALSFEKAIVSV